MLDALRQALKDGGTLAIRLAALITPAELDSTRARVDALLASGKHPEPSGEWPAIPGRPCRQPMPHRPLVRKSALPAIRPGPVRVRNTRPVRLMTCMPGPLPRSPPCLVRAAT